MKIKVKKKYFFHKAITRFFDFNRDTRLKACYIRFLCYSSENLFNKKSLLVDRCGIVTRHVYESADGG